MFKSILFLATIAILQINAQETCPSVPVFQGLIPANVS
jgi:hypothetical protein